MGQFEATNLLGERPHERPFFTTKQLAFDGVAGMAEQLTLTMGRSRRRLHSWISELKPLLPLPVWPRTGGIEESVAATRSASANVCRIAALRPMMRSRPEPELRLLPQIDVLSLGLLSRALPHSSRACLRSVTSLDSRDQPHSLAPALLRRSASSAGGISSRWLREIIIDIRPLPRSISHANKRRRSSATMGRLSRIRCRRNHNAKPHRHLIDAEYRKVVQTAVQKWRLCPGAPLRDPSSAASTAASTRTACRRALVRCAASFDRIHQHLAKQPQAGGRIHLPVSIPGVPG